MSTGSSTAQRRDRKLLIWLFGGVVLLIAGVSVLTPRQTEQNPQPSTDKYGLTRREGGIPDAAGDGPDGRELG